MFKKSFYLLKYKKELLYISIDVELFIKLISESGYAERELKLIKRQIL